jgi:transcriptional regulator with XRE-family HTH domain
MDKQDEALKDQTIEWIQHILNRKNWTGTDLARQSELAPSTILRLMNDPRHTSLPSFATIKKIANGSGYPVPRVLLESFGARVEAGPDSSAHDVPEPPPGLRQLKRMSTAGGAVTATRERSVKVRSVSTLPEALQAPDSSEVTVPCPPQLDHDDTAFAFYLHESTFDPIFRSGTLMYATKRRSPMPGDLVLVTRQDGRNHVRIVSKIKDDEGLVLASDHLLKVEEVVSYKDIKELAVVGLISKL